ncbi:helix-turn-helix domain-containing protein [Pedobacter steynii]
MKTLKTFFKKHKEGFKVPFKASKNIASHILDIQYATGSSVMFGFLKLMDRLQEMDDQVKPLCSKTYSLNVSESEGRRLSKIINYIMGRYNTQLSLEEIADIAFMTPQAFCRYFKKHTGHTFVSFLNEVR